MKSPLKLILTTLFFTFLITPVSAQGIITFSSGTLSNDTVQLSFTTGEPVSGTFSNASMTLFAGVSSFNEQMPTSVSGNDPEIPTVFNLRQNYPNPFNPSTTIPYDLPKSSEVRIDVYNIIGVKVATLVNGIMPAGSHTVQFDASALASGMYLYRFFADGQGVSTKKMMLIK